MAINKNLSINALYIIGTPIGNLNDISIRAIEVLKAVDLIAAEDTRRTRKLLSHFDIKTQMISYHQHNENKQSEWLLQKIREGESVALVTDGGMPVISDPGNVIIDRAHKDNISVIPIPGPSALTTSVAVSGFDIQQFIFLGFLPSKPGSRRKIWHRLKNLEYAFVLYEAPHRFMDCLKEICQYFPQRQISVCREMTKIHEETLRGLAAELLKKFESREIKGEFTLVIDKSTKELIFDESIIIDELKNLLAEGMSNRTAAEKLAKDADLPYRKVYRLALKISSQ